MPVFLDITDRTTLGSSVTTVLERWGRIDVLVNNARYIGPGHMDRLLDTPVELLDKHLEGNVMAPIILTKLVLPQMIERKSGVIMTITSGAGRGDPPAAAGEGGWGLGYGMSKGAVHRLIGIVKLEHERDGIVAYNLHPGFVTTERMIQDMGAFGFDADAGAPADVIGAAAAWLCTAPEAREMNGQWIEGQELSAELGLLPGMELAVTGEHPAVGLTRSSGNSVEFGACTLRFGSSEYSIEHVFVSEMSDPLDLIRDGLAALAAEDRSGWSAAAQTDRLLELRRSRSGSTPRSSGRRALGTRAAAYAEESALGPVSLLAWKGVHAPACGRRSC